MRGDRAGARRNADDHIVEIVRARVRRKGRGVGIFAFGTMLAPALAAANSLDASVADMRFVKPLDEALVLEYAASHELLVSVEENAIAGGAGAAVAEFLAAHGITVPLLLLGLPDLFLEHGKPQDMLSGVGLDAAGIEAAIRERLSEERRARKARG